ncbi:helix-turn-helix domain-containing protein [Polymorphobacter sp.]|uniref:helix-turn-helix domain-containing protein n=1 Tax=Polymorphobacter sp. TaxID=1909290 RepID=UPI003F72E0D9
MVSIRYFAPAPALRPYISSYYSFRCSRPLLDDLMRAELPQIRFVLQGRGSNHYGDGSIVGGLQTLLQGPTSCPVHFVAEGPLHVFGIGLLPQGWATLIEEPADRLADTAIDLAALLGRAADDLYEALILAGDDAMRVAITDGFLLARLSVDAAPTWFTRLADDWLLASPAPQVDTLVKASGMSQRTVERMCQRLYGAGPKLLARKYRALGAAVRLGTGEAADWTETSEGFYDQAHFIREFKHFVGLTPSHFLDEGAQVMRLTIARKTLIPHLPRLAIAS